MSAELARYTTLGTGGPAREFAQPTAIGELEELLRRSESVAVVGLGPNLLVLRIQPDEGITLRFGAKVPGTTFDIRTVEMDMTWCEEFGEQPPDSYERLLHDALVGDPTLFIRSDEVDAAWRVVQPILDAWALDPNGPVRYAAGSWGPRESDRLLDRDGRTWRNPEALDGPK